MISADDLCRRGGKATDHLPPPIGKPSPTASCSNGLVLGFGAVCPDESSRGMQRLTATIETATRR
jgi:hypothetical protein